VRFARIEEAMQLVELIRIERIEGRARDMAQLVATVVNEPLGLERIQDGASKLRDPSEAASVCAYRP
jgi:hypothetical protein